MAVAVIITFVEKIGKKSPKLREITIFSQKIGRFFGKKSEKMKKSEKSGKNREKSEKVVIFREKSIFKFVDILPMFWRFLRNDVF
jgi:hypothetical protein